MTKNKKTPLKQNNLLIGLLMIIAVASTCISVYLLFIYQKNTPIMPDYMPVEQDEHVVTIPSKLKEKPMEIPKAGGGVIIICDTQITVHLNTGKIDIDYQNPANSASVVVLQLLIGDEVVAQSGSIYPGYQLQDMYLLDTIQLQEGGYYGIIKTAFYDPDSGEKSLVDTDIEVSITVVP